MNGEHALEDIVGKMLTEVRLPSSGMTTLSLGSLRELRLPAFDERTSLPMTTTECINLLRSIGVCTCDVCVYVCTCMCICVGCVVCMQSGLYTSTLFLNCSLDA